MSSSKDNTRMLPSISNLLISSPYHNKDTPTLNLSPASPILSFPSTPPTHQHSNEKSPTTYLTLDNNVSPILSPISSPSSSPYLNGIRYLSLNNNTSDPPLEGDDPPQRLRLPSPSLSSSSNNNIQQSPISPKSLFTHNSPPWNTNKTIHHSPTPSCSSIGSSSVHSFEESIDTATTIEQPQRRRSTVIEEDPIPNTQIVFDASGQPILKRRRGRPPTCNTNFEGGGWTFLTPTVWDIHVSEEQKERELKADNEILARSKSIQAQHSSLDDHSMTDSMNAFTNSNMDTLLQMPRKKRGRKPKTHIAGNSCFVWKDLTSTRTSTKK